MSDKKPLTVGEDDERLRHKIVDCFQCWWGTEVALSALFAAVIKTDEKISFQIWDSVISFDAKLKCLNSVIEVTQSNNSTMPLWMLLSQKVNAVSKKRNGLAHGGITIRETRKHFRAVFVPYLSIGSLQYPRDSQKQTFYRYEDMCSLEREINDLSDAIFWFRKKHYPDQNKQEELPEQAPDLIIRLQKSIDQSHE